MRRALTVTCLLACTVLIEEPIRLIQDGPQRVEERKSHEWCEDKALDGRSIGFYLIERTYWVVDGRSLRSERQDTPASQSRVLWQRKAGEGRDGE